MQKRAIIITFIISIVITVSGLGQINKARKEISLFNYSEAVVFLQKDVKSNNPATKREAVFLLAECYRKQNDMENAKLWYGKSVELGGADPISLYYFAQALRSSGGYLEAKKMFLRYDSIAPGDPRGKIYADYCDSAMAWQFRKPHFEITNVTSINTPQSEFGVVFYKNGVVFASDRNLSKREEKIYGWTGYNYLRLFFAEKTHTDNQVSNFSQPVSFTISGEQNWHEGPAGFNRECTEIFINRTLLDKDKGKKDPGRIRTHLLKIYTASALNGKWSEPQPFFLNSDEYSVGHPALSADGKTLYFVSDMAGGFGGTDIYMCIREAGKWSQPVNLGREINTFGNEMFPYIASNGDLFFASDGFPGLGGLDLFVIQNIGGKWTKPENLGQPVNSSYDDFSLTTADTCKTGFFSSNRPGGHGCDDIYSFTPIPPPSPPSPPPPPLISGCVKDKTTREPIPGATVFLLDKDPGQVLIIKTDEKGCFTTPVIKGRSYLAKATKTSCLPDCLAFRIDTLIRQVDLTIPRDLLLDKLEMNKKFILADIFYDFDKWNIRADAEPSLNDLVRILKENPVTVELGSHTDCRGSEEYNRILSQKRAESAVRYIVRQGIDPGRIIAKGYGKSQLINRCNCAEGRECTEAEHQANRRTEFRITGLSEQKTDHAFDPERFKAGGIINVRELPDGFFGNCNLE